MDVALNQHQPFAFNVDLFTVGIPLIILFVIPLVRYVLRNSRSATGGYFADWWILVIAAFAWYWALQLPNIPITDQTNTTLMHFLGGAVVGPCLLWYFVRTYAYTMPRYWWERAVVVIAFAFGLFGGAFEVLEFTLTQIGLYKIELSDTSWDLATDLAGTCATLIVVEVHRAAVRTHWGRKPVCRNPVRLLAVRGEDASTQ